MTGIRPSIRPRTLAATIALVALLAFALRYRSDSDETAATAQP